MPRISESELVIPALQAMYEEGGCITTTNLISVLRNKMNPQGEDLEILSGRNDDKFSQKVRNLKSHDSLEGLASYHRENDNGVFCITDEGKKYIK